MYFAYQIDKDSNRSRYDDHPRSSCLQRTSRILISISRCITVECFQQRGKYRADPVSFQGKRISLATIDGYLSLFVDGLAGRVVCRDLETGQIVGQGK